MNAVLIWLPFQEVMLDMCRWIMYFGKFQPLFTFIRKHNKVSVIWRSNNAQLLCQQPYVFFIDKTLSTQKQRYPFLWQILTRCTPFYWEKSHILDFLFKIEIRQVHLDWRCFQSALSKLAPVRAIFVGFQWFAHHFDEDCLTNQNLFRNQNRTSVARAVTILVCSSLYM
jgi:hypothetical protein